MKIKKEVKMETQQLEKINDVKLLEIQARGFLNLCSEVDTLLENKYPAQTSKGQ